MTQNKYPKINLNLKLNPNIHHNKIVKENLRMNLLKC